MSRTSASVSQADVARAIRAARQAGAAGVEIRQDGSIYVHLHPPAARKSLADVQKGLEGENEVVL